MCDTCYYRGYNDYPKWVGSTHIDSYRKGWEAKKRSVGGNSMIAPSKKYCHKCYNRGYHDGLARKWVPPIEHGGHYESYKLGYDEATK